MFLRWIFQAKLHSSRMLSKQRYACRHPPKMNLSGQPPKHKTAFKLKVFLQTSSKNDLSKSWKLPANWRCSCRHPPNINLPCQHPKHKTAFKPQVFLQTSSKHDLSKSWKLPANWRYSCRHPQKMISKSWNLPANWRYSCRQPPKMNLSGQPPKHKSAFKLKVFLQTSSLNEPFKPTVSPLRQLNECLPGGLWP